MRAYLHIIRKILEKGISKPTRTGISTIAIPSATFTHDMAKGFPLLTTRKMPFKSSRVETEGFLNGVTDKKWYQDRGCRFWDHWCNKKLVPPSNDEETKARMRAERDLGPIYGWQWRHFGANYTEPNADYTRQGVDQLARAIKTLRADPTDRKQVVSAWNPVDVPKMALEPCHYSFHPLITGGKLHLSWTQRSVDSARGLPNNISQYALILHLLAKEFSLEEGTLTGFLEDTHLYENQIPGAKEQVTRRQRQLPKIETPNFTSIFDWTHDQTRIVNYNPDNRKIDFGEIAV